MTLIPDTALDFPLAPTEIDSLVMRGLPPQELYDLYHKYDATVHALVGMNTPKGIIEQWEFSMQGMSSHLRRRHAQFDLENLYIKITGIKKKDTPVIKDAKADPFQSELIVPWRLNRAQIEILLMVEKDIEDGIPIRYIILKARQLGMSTFIEGWIYRQLKYVPGSEAAIISHEDPSTEHLYGMYRLFFSRDTSHDCRPAKDTGKGFAYLDANKKRMGGVTLFSGYNANAGTSFTLHFVHASEIDKWRNPDETMSALRPCIHYVPRTAIFIESTAKGIGNYMHRAWYQEDDPFYKHVFFGWYYEDSYCLPFREDKQKERFMNTMEAPEIAMMEKHSLSWEQMHWYVSILKSELRNNRELMMQEYPATPEDAFRGAGQSPFVIYLPPQWERVRKKEETNEQVADCDSGFKEQESHELQPIRKYDFQANIILRRNSGQIVVYDEPRPGHVYIIGIDTAEGKTVDGKSAKKRDCTAVEVFDRGKYSNAPGYPMVQCTEWVHQEPIHTVADAVKALAIRYNKAWLNIEANNHGFTLITLLRDSYHNILARIDPLEQRAEVKFVKTGLQMEDTPLGFLTSKKTKPRMMEAIIEAIDDPNGIWIYSRDLLDELSAVGTTESGAFEAAPGNRDDRVIALGLCILGDRTAPRTSAPIRDEHEESFRKMVAYFRNLGKTTGDPDTMERKGFGGVTRPSRLILPS